MDGFSNVPCRQVWQDNILFMEGFIIKQLFNRVRCFMLKQDDVVKIYKNPYSEEREEGEAKLLKRSIQDLLPNSILLLSV